MTKADIIGIRDDDAVTPTYYTICTGEGDELTTGVQIEGEARRIAQRFADDLGKSVYLSGPDADDEEYAPSEDVIESSVQS